MPGSGKSLAASTLWKMALRVGLVIVGMTAIAYVHVYSLATAQSVEQLKKYIVERGQRERAIFSLAERNQKRLKQEIIEEVAKFGDVDPIDVFNRHFTRFADGTVRTRLEGYDGTKQAFGFIGQNVRIDADFRRRAMLFLRLSNKYGPAWHHTLQNVYFTLPENALIGYWPEVPTWPHDAPADWYLPDEEFMAVANVQNDPARETMWTGLFYDVAGKTWMVSVETPVDVKGRHIATIGHDITLSELMDRTVNDHLEGAYNLIIRKDGRLIADPQKMDVLLKAGGNLSVTQSADPHLKSVYQTIVGIPEDHFVVEHSGFDHYLAVAKIPEPGWFFVTVYPKSLIAKVAFETARIVLLLGAASLLLEILIMYMVLKGQVTRPLGTMLAAVQRIGRGDMSARLEVERSDELGSLAKEVNAMADSISANTLALERKVEERTADLSKSNAALDTAQRTASVGSWEWDLSADRMIWSNQFYRILGYEPGECEPVLENVLRRVHPDDIEPFLSLTARENRKSQPDLTFEFRILRPNGDLTWVEARRSVEFDDDGDPIRTGGTFQDITVRKAADEALKKSNESLERARQEAETATETKSRFLAAASHDLRQPLQAAILYQELLASRIDDDEQSAIVNKSLASLNAATDILNALLDISKVDSGSVKIEKQNFPLKMVFEHLEDVEPFATSRGLEYRIGPTDAVVRTDPVLLETILRNLLTNAVKNTEDGGRIVLRSKPSDNQVRIEVSDTGIGIAEDKLDAIFEEFYQVGNEARNRDRGLGLGLSIVKRMASLLDHRIEAKSKLGEGSVFSIEVPIAEGAADRTFDEANAADTSAPNRLLVLIDDDLAVLRSLELLLKNGGYDIAACHFSGPECPEYLALMQQCAQHTPDLIISDFRLPKNVTGFDVIAQLRGHTSPTLPALILTGDTKDLSAEVARDGNLAVIHKPVRRADLYAAINDLLEVPHKADAPSVADISQGDLASEPRPD